MEGWGQNVIACTCIVWNNMKYPRKWTKLKSSFSLISPVDMNEVIGALQIQFRVDWTIQGRLEFLGGMSMLQEMEGLSVVVGQKRMDRQPLKHCSPQLLTSLVDQRKSQIVMN